VALIECRECGGDVSSKAPTCPYCGYPIKKPGIGSTEIGCGRCLIIVLVGLFLLGYVTTECDILKPRPKKSTAKGTSNTPKSSPASRPSKTLSIGEVCELYTSDDEVIIARSEEALETLVRSAVAKDAAGLAEAVLLGQAFLVKSGTKAKVLERKGLLATRYKVRIVEGDHIMEIGWVPSEFARRSR